MKNIISDTRRLNIAVWGLGKHAINKILPSIIHCPCLTLTGVYSRNQTVVHENMRRYGCRTWSSPEKMLEDMDLDIIYISTPIALHAEQGLNVLKSGKHCWIEKPLTNSLDDTYIMVDTAKRHGLSLFECFMYQYHPQYQLLKEYIGKSEIGNIKSVYCKFGIPSLDYPGFRYNKLLGGSALYDIGCYPISALLDLIPGEQPNIIFKKLKNMKEYDVDIEGFVQLSFPSGINAFLEWDMERSYRNEIDIWGTEKSVYTEKIFSKNPEYEPILQIRDKHGNLTNVVVEKANHFITMLNAFVSSVKKTDFVENEYKNILKRASYLDKISGKSSVDR